MTIYFIMTQSVEDSNIQLCLSLFFFFFGFLRWHLWHMDFLVQWSNQSCSFWPMPEPQPLKILQTCILMDTSGVCTQLNHHGNSQLCLLIVTLDQFFCFNKIDRNLSGLRA